jgi:putative transposase
MKEVEKVKFSGERIKRDLYRSGSGKLINADVNASYNIFRKAFPKAFVEGIPEVRSSSTVGNTNETKNEGECLKWTPSQCHI